MALSIAAIRGDSVSLLMFPFLSQVQIFWCEMLFISHLNRAKSCLPPIFVSQLLSFNHLSCCPDRIIIIIIRSVRIFPNYFIIMIVNYFKDIFRARVLYIDFWPSWKSEMHLCE